MGRFATREQWLQAALDEHIRDHFRQSGYEVPQRIRVSCGWPLGGRKLRAIGQCWASTCSKDDTFEIFISPLLDQPPRVLDVLVHEVVHAVVGLNAGHKAPFKKCAVAVGLTGKMTATVATPALEALTHAWSALLDAFPHAQLTPSDDRKKQTTRLIKCECSECGCCIRITRKWLDQAGPPVCGCQHEQFEDGNDHRMIVCDDDDAEGGGE